MLRCHCTDGEGTETDDALNVVFVVAQALTLAGCVETTGSNTTVPLQATVLDVTADDEIVTDSL
jgi:hypothetical protein